MIYKFESRHVANDSQPPRPPLAIIQSIAEKLAGLSDADDRWLGAIKELAFAMEADCISLQVMDRNQADFGEIRLAPIFERGVKSEIAGLARQAVERKTTVACNHSMGHQTDDINNSHHDMESGVAHPVMVGGEVIGVIEASSRHAHHFTPYRQNLLAIVSNILGPVVRDSLLVQQLESETLALESIGDAVTFVDQDANIRYVNRAFCQMYGYSTVEISGQPLSLLAPQYTYNQKQISETFEKGIRSGWRGEATAVRKNGEEFQISLTTAPLMNASGQVMGLMGVAQEITARKSAEADQRRLTQENSALAEIGRIISTSLHIDTVFEKFASEMKKLVAFDRATLNEVDEETGKYTLKYVSGVGVPGQVVGRVGDLEGTLTQYLAGSEKALARPDIAKDKRFADDQQNLNAGFRSGVAVSLNSQGRSIASLSLLSRQVNAFGQREASLLERLANQIAPALENARLYEDARHQAQEIQVVADLAKIISSNLDIHLVYSQFASEVKQLLDLDWLGITILDEVNNTMRLDYLSRKEGAHFNLGDSLPLDGTFSAEAIRTRSIVVVGDLNDGSSYWTAKYLVADGLRSCITVPLFSKEKIIATMVVLSSNADAYGPREQQLLERLALQIGPAVENSILFQEMEQHALALESIRDGVTFVDASGTFQFVNRAFEKMYGLETGEVTGKNFASIIQVDDASQTQSRLIFQEGLEQGWHGELAQLRSDGEEFYIHLTVTPVHDRDGRVIGEIGVSRDITSQKAAEEELFLRNQELETLVHIASLLVRDVPFQKKCEDMLEALATSVQAEMVTLRTPDEEKGGLRLISQAGPANWEQQEMLPWRTVSGETLESGVPMVVNNYQESPLALAKEIERGINSMVSLPIAGGTDQILGIVNVVSQEVNHFTPERIRFLTAVAGGIGSLLENARLYQQNSLELEQRQRAEEALRESENRFRQLYDDAPVGYHEMDRDGCIIRVNRTELDMLGFSENEILGRPVWDFFEDPKASKASFEAKFSGKMPPGRGYEETFICKNGNTLAALIEDRPIYDDTGEIVGFRSTIQDITERKFAEEKLRETARLVSIGELAAGVAHEINNPLTVVAGFSELLDTDDVPEPARGYARMVHTEALRATKVVHNLLSFARRHEQEMRYCDVREVIDRALDLKAYHHKTRNIEVVNDIPSNIPWTMLDEHQLLQVITNLLTNAEQAIPDDRDGKIEIHVTKKTDRIRISVSDNGSGIPADVLPKIFDPFFTTKDVGSGTGLGLSICYGIVGQHGGDMWAESRKGKGATFYLELPILDGEPDGDPPNIDFDASVVGPKRVLAVDDEPGVRNLLHEILNADGHEVELASDAAAAREMVKQGGFDLLLLDLRMPGGGGRDLYEWVKKHDRRLAAKAIFVTGDAAREDTGQFLEATGNPIISKPFRLDDLRRAIRMLFP